MRDGRIDSPAFFSLLNIKLKLMRRLIILLILRSYLCVPCELARRQLVEEDEHDVARQSFLGHNDLLTAIDNEITTLIIHALLLLQNLARRAVMEVALLRADHQWDLAEFDSYFVVARLNFCGLVFVLVKAHLYYLHINVALNLVGQVTNPRLMGVNRG